MAGNVVVWHFPSAVTGHSLARGFLSSLKEISDRDYPGKNYFKHDIPALDIDRYEVSREGSNQKTADAVVGICNRRQEKPVNGRLLMVELRMNYRNVENLSVSALSGKESHTRDILHGCPDDVLVDLTYCLVFDPGLEELATRWLFRQQRANSRLNAWKSFSPEKFCNYINAGVELSPDPKEETIILGERLKHAAEKSDVDLLEAEWDAVREYMTLCGLRYELIECRYLSDVIKEALSSFDESNVLNEYERGYLHLLRDEMLKIAEHYSVS